MLERNPDEEQDISSGQDIRSFLGARLSWVSVREQDFMRVPEHTVMAMHNNKIGRDDSTVKFRKRRHSCAIESTFFFIREEFFFIQ